MFGFCGAAALLRREAIDDVGTFDESFFMYYEDTDLSWRLRLRGWKVLYDPRAVVEHGHSRTSGEWSDFFLFHVDRNRLLMVLKDAPAPLVARSFSALGLRAARLRRPEADQVPEAPVDGHDLSRLQPAAQKATRRLALRGRVLQSFLAHAPEALAARGHIPAANGPGQRGRPWDGPEAGVGRSLRVGLHSPYFGSTYGGGEKYLGTVAEVLRDAYPEHRIEIVSPVPVDRERYRSVLGLDLAGITLRSGTRRVTPVHRALARAPGLRPLRNALVARQAAALTREYDLWIAMAYVIPAVSRAARSVMLCQFPYPLRGERGRRDLAAFDRSSASPNMSGGASSGCGEGPRRVLYPPIEIPPGEPDWQAKRPWILSVGRFVAGGHVKRHDLLVRAFRQLCDGGVRGWSCISPAPPPGSGQPRLLPGGGSERGGVPIRVRTDIPRDELRAEYAGASLYWHAAGYGVDEASHPEASSTSA